MRILYAASILAAWPLDPYPKHNQSRLMVSRILLAACAALLTACEPDNEVFPPVTQPELRDPDWHPSLPLIAFASGVGGVGHALETLSLPDRGHSRLLDGNVSTPHWHPSNGSLVLSLDRRIAVLDGQDVRFLTETGDISISPRWSPDGTWIAYESNATPTGAYNVWIHELATGTASRLNTDGGFLDGAAYPEWSPGGDSLVVAFPFRTSQVTYRVRLLMVSLLTGDTTYLTPPDYDARIPRWHPDGSHIAYQRSLPGDQGDLWLLDLTDLSQERLAREVGTMAWSVSGDSLVFTRLGSDALELWLLDINTSAETLIATPTD